VAGPGTISVVASAGLARTSEAMTGFHGFGLFSRC
jgi:hypothetical protein